MTQVVIKVGDREVTVDHDGAELAYVVERAQKLWDAVKDTPLPLGPAYGFSAERDRGLAVSANKIWGGEIDPVRA